MIVAVSAAASWWEGTIYVLESALPSTTYAAAENVPATGFRNIQGFSDPAGSQLIELTRCWRRTDGMLFASDLRISNNR